MWLIIAVIGIIISLLCSLNRKTRRSSPNVSGVAVGTGVQDMHSVRQRSTSLVPGYHSDSRTTQVL
jgi:NO-binding membrane sensor protein with MHYT domain